MDSASLIAFSATVDRACLVAAGLFVLVLGLLAVLRGRRVAAPDVDAPMRRSTELVLLGVVLAFGALVRTVGWNELLTPVFWFAEVPQLHVANMLAEGTFWPTLTRLLHTYQGGWTHESAIVLPVLVVLQDLVGPSLGLPVLLGAVFGLASIVLAWLLGRATRSQAFGLLFAAFVACSPLQITWSRLGGFFIAASPQVLLSLLCGYVAGRRRSATWTVVAGLVAWTSLYHYYAARVAIPLAGAALLRGSQDAHASGRRRIVLATLFVATIAGVLYGLEGGGFRRVFWPSYGGYVGNRGEQGLAELVTRNVDYVSAHGREALARYFLRSRTRSSVAWRWGVEHGGLCLEPLGVLGAVGLLSSLSGVRRRWLWPVMLAAGLALPSLSVSTARRFLVMDLAWCALAAHGLLALAHVLGRGVSRRSAAAIVGGVSGAIALWSAIAVFTLDDAMPHGAEQPIPFGESGFGDGFACRRCAEAGTEWQHEIADGAFVVLFDSDPFRENRTSPAGLPVYGKLAALVAGAPGRFIDGYALMIDWDIEPPSAAGPMFDRAHTSFADFLLQRMERSAPTRIVWHFERPTLWERWLAQRLVDAGGERHVFETPLAPRSEPLGLEVVTPWEAREPALAIVRELARGRAGDEESQCIRLAPGNVTEEPMPGLVLAAPDGAGVDRPPPWVTGGYQEVRFTGRRWDVAMPIGATVLQNDHGGTLEVMAKTGLRTAIDLRSDQQGLEWLPFAIQAGLDCATRIGKYWWVVEPMSGRLRTTHPDGAWVPQAPWIGITRGPDGELVLASADQTVVVLDVEGRRELARFPATVSPSRRIETDECSLVAVGRGWIATLNLDSVLNVYDPKGRPLGTRRLDVATALTAPQFSAMGAAGRYLGLGMWTTMRSVELTVDPSCGEAPAGG